MAEDVNLTAQAESAINVSVQNAIGTVLGQSDPNMAMAAAQDIMNLENTISRKFKTLTDSITDVASKIGDLRSSQDEAARQNAVTATESEQQTTPLMRIANTIDLIYYFLTDKFKATGLGTEDANVGMLNKPEKEADPTDGEQIKKDEKTQTTSNEGSIFVAGTIVAATLKAIKDKLDETWSGVTMTILKPYIAIREALKGLPKAFDSLKTRISNFTGKIWKGFSAKFPNLAKTIEKVIDSVKGFKDSIVKAVKNFNLGKFFQPLFDSIKSVAGGGGFGKVIAILKKFALPLTLVMEAFEAFKMIFVGSFSKNAQALSDSISEKGILGRAWYGFTHMFQTIATFGYELVDSLKAVGVMALTFLDPVVEAFHSLTDTISNMFIDMYNYVAGWIPGMDQIETEEAKKMSRRDKLTRTAGGSEDIADKLIDRGAKVGVELEDGDDFISFKNRIQAAERAKKMQEEAATIKKENPEPYGVGRYKNQTIQQNAIQNNTTFEIQMPTAGDIIDQ